MRRRTITAALAAALSLAAAAPAAADSISYLKDGDVWLTTPDGSRQTQVTRTGGYSYASQADDGTIIALVGERLHKLSRDGKVLADFDTPVSDGPKKGPNENYFMGPYEPEISPDGSLVTYGYAWHHERYDHTCRCVRWGIDSGTAITHPDRQTGWEEFGGPLTGWMFASWMSNDTILRSYAGRAFAEEAVVNRVGPGKGDDDMISWLDSTFDMDEVFQFRDGAIAPGGGAAAFVTYDVGHHGESYRNGFNRIRVYRMTGPPPARPQACFWIDGEDKPDTMASPAFSPDGSKLAYQYGNKISVVDVPDFSGGCTLPDEPRELTVGALPDWGPADVPVAKAPEASAPTAPKSGPAPGAKGTGEQPGKPGQPGRPGQPATAAELAVELPGSVKLRTALRKGIALPVSTGTAGRVTAIARIKGAKVGAGAAEVGARGAGKVVIRFTRKAKRALRRRGSVRLAIAVAFDPAGGGATRTRTVPLRLRR